MTGERRLNYTYPSDMLLPPPWTLTTAADRDPTADAGPGALQQSLAGFQQGAQAGCSGVT